MCDDVVLSDKAACRTAVVYSTDGGYAWRTRLSIASLAKQGVPQSRIFILSPGSHGVRDMYVSEHATQVDVGAILRNELGMPAKNWDGKWPYALLCKLAAPLLDELAPFDQVLCLDTDTLAHTAALWDLMAYPCCQYEAVGGALYRHGLGFASGSQGTSLAAAVDRVLRTILSDAQYGSMRDRIWKHNPLLYRVWFNDGICLLNLRRIREDMQWYIQRAGWLYDGIGRGLINFLTETFCTAFLDAAALLPPDLVTHNGTVTPPYPTFRPAVVHYNGRAQGPVGSDMVRDARKLGLDEAAFEHV